MALEKITLNDPVKRNEQNNAGHECGEDQRRAGVKQVAARQVSTVINEAALCIKRTNNIAASRRDVNHHMPMHDKTIDNALLALRQIGGHQGKLAEVLLEMRGVPLPYVYQFQPAKRGGTKRLCIAALQDGPKTTRQVGDILMMEKPDLSRRNADQRAYAALLRLVDNGSAVRDGKLWSIKSF